jgi:hypothetical protein
MSKVVMLEDPSADYLSVHINFVDFIFIVIVILFAKLDKLFCGVALVNGKIS